MLKRIPYGPAGIDLTPNGVKTIIQTSAMTVETIDETSMND